MTLQRRNDAEGQDVSQQAVSISMTDLISLMAKQVATQVVDELREKDIAPILTRIGAIEIRQAQPIPELQRTTNNFSHMKGMFDGAWKLAVIALAAIEAWHYAHH